jgi:hypothetical protein
MLKPTRYGRPADESPERPVAAEAPPPPVQLGAQHAAQEELHGCGRPRGGLTKAILALEADAQDNHLDFARAAAG